MHKAIDMAAMKNTHVMAAAGGKVVEARYASGYGNTILIAHPNGYKTRYAHLNAIKVKLHAIVAAGDLIGTVGETGFIRKRGKDGSHLHFEVYHGNRAINPLAVLPRLS